MAEYRIQPMFRHKKVTMMPKKMSRYLLILPSLLFLLVFLIYPMVNTVYQSFWNLSYFKPDDRTFVGLKNYIKLFSQSGFKHSLFFTLRFTFACIVLEFIIGLFLALLLRKIAKGGRIIRTISIFPYMIAPIAAGQIWCLLFGLDYGIVNYALGKLSIAPINWLGSNAGAFWAVVIAQVWKSTPLVMLILLSGLQSIPVEVYEAAVVDGANALRTFRHITIPLLIPSITIALVFETIFHLRVYDLVITLTGGGPGKATTPLGVMLKQNYFQTYEAGYAGAISGVLILLGAAFSILYIFLINHQPKKKA
jgi:multiple sugar transport system permease protein